MIKVHLEVTVRGWESKFQILHPPQVQTMGVLEVRLAMQITLGISLPYHDTKNYGLHHKQKHLIFFFFIIVGLDQFTYTLINPMRP